VADDEIGGQREVGSGSLQFFDREALARLIGSTDAAEKSVVGSCR